MQIRVQTFGLFPALATSILLSVSTIAQTTWTSTDVGRSTPAGQTIAADSGFDLTSATGDIWGYADNCRFVYQSATGDFDFRTRLEGLAGSAYWTKAGAMVRGSLEANGVNGFVAATREAGWGRYMFTARLADWFSSAVYLQGSFTRVDYPDVWVRLVRIEDTLYPMSSTNGVVWEQMGSQLAFLLSRAAFVGMTVSNHPESGSAPATARFRDIALIRGPPAAPVVTSQPTSVKANVGQSVTLTVAAAGKNPLSYEWHRDGIPLSNGGTLPSLRLTNLSPETAGKYVCRISNSDGVVWSWASQVEMVSKAEPSDGIHLDLFDRSYGRLVEYLINASNFPASPVGSLTRNLLEIPSIGNDTGARLQGFLTPPVTGLYTFFIAADDSGRLLLSTDDNPTNARIIAECPFWVNPREWDYYYEQESIPIRLQAGQRYYVEAIFKGEGTPNHGAVGWSLPDGRMERPIPRSRFVAGIPSLHLIMEGVVRVEGTLNSPYVIESSGDLREWSPMETNRAPFEYRPLRDPIPSFEFFRARSVP